MQGARNAQQLVQRTFQGNQSVLPRTQSRQEGAGTTVFRMRRAGIKEQQSRNARRSDEERLLSDAQPEREGSTAAVCCLRRACDQIEHLRS